MPLGSVARAAEPRPAAARIEYSTAEPAPTGELRVACPTIAWKISPNGSTRVTGVSLTLNRKPVTARFDAARSRVTYTPDAPLSVGSYDVHCKVVLNGQFAVEKNWQFRVGACAQEKAADPAPDQTTLVAEINAVRRQLNLPPLKIDARLCAAAAVHSGYLAANRAVGHEQNADKAEYVAASAGDRVSAFGYAGSCYESISQGLPAAVEAVRGLFDAPYHRAPFLQPGVFDVGAGVKKDIVTLLFGASEAVGVVTYPTDGQKDVPTRWSGNETPNPLRVHGGGAATGPTGYIITFFSFGGDDPKVIVAGATLTAPDGRAVPVWLNTPANDDFLKNGALIIPRKPLAPATTYRVTVEATDDSGADRSRSWSFTTAAAPAPVAAAVKPVKQVRQR
jgi:uncharacterized protein YkwD